MLNAVFRHASFVNAESNRKLHLRDKCQCSRIYCKESLGLNLLYRDVSTPIFNCGDRRLEKILRTLLSIPTVEAEETTFILVGLRFLPLFLALEFHPQRGMFLKGRPSKK